MRNRPLPVASLNDRRAGRTVKSGPRRRVPPGLLSATEPAPTRPETRRRARSSPARRSFDAAKTDSSKPPPLAHARNVAISGLNWPSRHVRSAHAPREIRAYFVPCTATGQALCSLVRHRATPDSRLGCGSVDAMRGRRVCAAGGDAGRSACENARLINDGSRIGGGR